MTQQVITLVTKQEQSALLPPLLQQLQALLPDSRTTWLGGHHALDIYYTGELPHLKDTLPALIGDAPIDYCVQPVKHRRKQLLISDMDSTIIGQECIDEIADMVGIKAQVADITERAMQGELDFSASLIARVALLKGVPCATLQRVWEERITLNAGAAQLVQTMRHHGAYTMLVSGGFTFFSEKVAQAAGFEAHIANELLITQNLPLFTGGGRRGADESSDATLTGEVRSPIIHKEAKRDLLLKAAQERSIPLNATVAIGDGANDAAMIETAGLGVAYRAKPALRALADAAITHTDLTTLLYFQGYTQTEFV